jgi:predicted protein tyrosine phosphatase
MCDQIIVLNRLEAEDYTCDVPWACVSIADTKEDLPRLHRQRRKAILRLAFADIECPVPGYLLFSTGQAHDILDFVTRHWRRIRTLMVHCRAGLSRSPAVAAAVARLKLGDDSEFFEPPYLPNPWVYRTLLETASGRGDYGDWF